MHPILNNTHYIETVRERSSHPKLAGYSKGSWVKTKRASSHSTSGSLRSIRKYIERAESEAATVEVSKYHVKTSEQVNRKTLGSFTLAVIRNHEHILRSL